MKTKTIRIWREGPKTMGAILGPNLAEGEAEFTEIRPPYGQTEQYFAAIDAVRKLEKRLKIGELKLPLRWSTAEAEHPETSDYRDDHYRDECEQTERDPADWWKERTEQ